MMKRIHCLGLLVVDALSGPISRYPEPGVVTQINTETLRFAPGGGAANTASALARLGLPVTIFSKVGSDLNGDFLLQQLAQWQVDTTGIQRADGESTPFTFVGIHPDGNRTFIHTPGVNRTFSPADIDLNRLLDTDILLYQDLWVLPSLDGPPGAALLAEAQRRGVVTLLDECWGLGPKRETLEAMLPYCDYVLPSADDLRVIYPDASVEEIAGILLDRGAGTAIIKLGAAGCLVAHGSSRIAVPSLPARVVDTTGAGDSWDAGFIAGLAHGLEPVNAAQLGNACAAFCVEAIGGATGIPAYAAIVARAAEHHFAAGPA
ncbi:MAG TPA: carbohydrate kinase family protein [Armatimonadota bacterium]